MPEVIPARRLVISHQSHRGQYFAEQLNEFTHLEMMQIPGGRFLMGSPLDELNCLEREHRQHEVSVPAFFIARTPITQAQWRAVGGYDRIHQDLNPAPSHFNGENRPVEGVSWDDAQEFCQRLSQKTGRSYRLPSEAEWEYACRARTTSPFHFWETLSDELANYCAQDREINGKKYKGTYGRGILGQYRQETTDVGQFPANRFGLYDLDGNVWEWCEDDWHPNYDGAPNDGSAWVESDRTEAFKLLRGGSWNYFPEFCRCATRDNRRRDNRNFNVGFRVSCVPSRHSS